VARRLVRVATPAGMGHLGLLRLFGRSLILNGGTVKKLTAVLILLTSTANAGTYFHYVAFKTVKAAAFFPVAGGIKDMSAGSSTPVFQHRSSDGYWLIPGVDWDALDLGWAANTSTGQGSVALGPSVDVAGPVKDLLYKAIEYLPGGEDASSYGALRYILGAGGDWKATVGPSFVVTTSGALNRCKGSLQIAAGLSKTF